MSLGAELRSARKKKGLSQRDVAEDVRKEDGSSITQQYLNDIELDRRVPSAKVIGELARVLGVSREVLEVRAGQMPRDVDVTRYPAEKVQKAMKAFRQELKK